MMCRLECLFTRRSSRVLISNKCSYIILVEIDKLPNEASYIAFRCSLGELHAGPALTFWWSGAEQKSEGPRSPYTNIRN